MERGVGRRVRLQGSEEIARTALVFVGASMGLPARRRFRSGAGKGILCEGEQCCGSGEQSGGSPGEQCAALSPVLRTRSFITGFYNFTPQFGLVRT